MSQRHKIKLHVVRREPIDLDKLALALLALAEQLQTDADSEAADGDQS